MGSSRRLAALLAALALGTAATARAQEHGAARVVVVVPWLVGPDTPSDAEDAILGLRGALEDDALAGEAAARALEAGGSRTSRVPDDATLDAWRALSRQAVRAIAQGEHAEGQAALARADQLVSGSLSAVARDEGRARTLLDTCMFGVRALAETRDPHARAAALACRRMLPTLAPTPHLHPPEVLEMLSEAERTLAAAPAAPLTITSDVGGCEVRLDGIVVGTTPLTLASVPPGTYELVVERPGEPHGRVHALSLDDQPRALAVDTAFEGALRTEGPLRLVYATLDEALAQRGDHALAIARMLGADELWLVAAGEADLVEHLDAHTGAPIAVDRTASDRTYAGARLSPPRRTEAEQALGGTLLALGGAAWITSLALLAPAQSYGTLATQPLPTDVDYLDRRARWEGWETPILVLGAIGPALAAASLPFLVEHEDEVPWWSWTLGAAGVVALGVGVGLAASAPTCGHERPTEECVAGTAQLDAGVATLAAGLTLVTLPLTHVLRGAIDAPVRLDASASTSGALARVTLAL